MIVAFVRVSPGQEIEALGLTLASLVPGVVHGLVGGAVVIGPGEGGDAEQVAEGAGALYLADKGEECSWRDAATLVRDRFVLLLAAGDQLGGDWAPKLERLLMAGAPPILRLRRRPATPLRRVSHWIGDAIKPGALTPGLLIRRDLLLGDRLNERVRRASIVIEASG